MKKAHTHALWIYGVIVGLAIREALTHVMPLALVPPSAAPLLDQLTPELKKLAQVLQYHPPPPATGQLILIGIRLVVFLVMVVRFYFGSVQYFTTMHDLTEQ